MNYIETELLLNSVLRFYKLFLQKMFLVMELCEFGDLRTIVFEGGNCFSEESARYIVKDLSSVIVYLHKLGNQADSIIF